MQLMKQFRWNQSENRTGYFLVGFRKLLRNLSYLTRVAKLWWSIYKIWSIISARKDNIDCRSIFKLQKASYIVQFANRNKHILLKDNYPRIDVMHCNWKSSVSFPQKTLPKKIWIYRCIFSYACIEEVSIFVLHQWISISSINTCIAYTKQSFFLPINLGFVAHDVLCSFINTAKMNAFE